ncbi:hypothetical protein L1887_03027 [Cichorium endivia]|nr:hypothetical protein L1887_03027 [Cichorium endivia]
MVGRGPCKKLLATSREWSFERFPSDNGSAEKQLSERDKNFRFNSCPRENGIVLFNMFPDKSSSPSNTRFPIDVGIGPVNLFEARYNPSKLVKFPRASGMVPVNSFHARYNSLKAVSLPSDAGISPPKLLFLRSSVSRSNWAHLDTMVDGPVNSPSKKLSERSSRFN